MRKEKNAKSLVFFVWDRHAEFLCIADKSLDLA
jgi:hypothetical protein